MRVAALVLLGLAACAGPPPTACPIPDNAERVYLVSRGWHVELGLPAEQLNGRLAVFRDLFPGARAFLFGYGKRTFFTAPAETLSEYLLGPVPGPAAIQVTALAVPPDRAYAGDDIAVLALPPGGGDRLADFIADDLGHDPAGAPQRIGKDPFPGSRFYAANSRYSLGHTCNTWTADALQAAGLPVTGTGVVFAAQVMSRAADAASLACHAP